jgi:hypothetical protein
MILRVMPKKPAKSRKNQPKEAKLYTPEPVQARVIARYVNGESNRQIAAQEHIDRGTVGKILSQQEALQMIARQRCRLQRMGDKALDVVEQTLNGDDDRLRVPVALKIIEHALPKGTMEEALNVANKLSPEAEAKERRLRIIAQIIDGSLIKAEVYGHPLEPQLEQVKKELDRRMEEEHSFPAVNQSRR